MRFVGTEQSKDYKRVLALFDKFGIKSDDQINSCYFERVTNTLQCIFQPKNND